MQTETLDADQIDYGKTKLKALAEKWRVTQAQAASILQDKDCAAFWRWVNADYFLNHELYNTEAEETSKTKGKNENSKSNRPEKPITGDDVPAMLGRSRRKPGNRL